MHNRAAFQIPHRKIAFLSGFRCLCSCPAETELTIVVDGVALGAGRGENKGGRGGQFLPHSPVPHSSLIQPALLSGSRRGKKNKKIHWYPTGHSSGSTFLWWKAKIKVSYYVLP